MFNLFRVLFPRWNFFDQVGFQFEIYYKISESQNWVKVDFQQKRRLFSFVYNPDLNLALAQFNVVEHFTQDLQDQPDKIEEMTSFKMIRSLVDFKLQEQNQPLTVKQFKIVARASSQSFDLYTSPWLKDVPLATV